MSKNKIHKKLKLSDYKGDYVVLFFYPKDMTPGCTLEARKFSELLPQFKKLGATVLGASRDSEKSHQKFTEKEDLALDLISDEEEELCQKFDVIKMKNMYGKQVRGIERSTFLFDPKGKNIHEWRKVKADGHAEEVLEHLKALVKSQK